MPGQKLSSWNACRGWSGGVGVFNAADSRGEWGSFAAVLQPPVCPGPPSWSEGVSQLFGDTAGLQGFRAGLAQAN